MSKKSGIFFGIIFLLTPLFMHSQNKPATVVKPKYDIDLSFQNNNNTSNISNIPSNILVTEDDVQEPKGESVSTTTEITVTTEIGDVTLDLATSTLEVEVETQRLSEVVERINQDYEVAEKECRNGSWLERVWCSMTSWL